MASCPSAAFGCLPRVVKHNVKRCPTCDTVYVDATTFCETDGDVLVEASEATSEPEPSRRTAALMATMPVAPPPADVPMVASGARMATALGRSPSGAALRGAIEDALAIAKCFERDGLVWQPQAEDFVRDEDGKLALTQARGVCKRTTAFDARWVLRAVGEALAPIPLVTADTSIVRALIVPRARPITLTDAKAEIAAAISVSPQSAALDIGFARERQEDSARVGAAGGVRFGVLCDGVSLSADGGLASRVGSEAAFAFLETRLAQTHTDDGDSVREAIKAAHQAVCARVALLTGPDAADDDMDPPGSTIVITIVRAGIATIGWLGDSRAYMVGDKTALLTKDHSWKNEVERLGYEGDASAMGNLGNALTRCIGPLEAGMRTDVEPDVITTTLEKGCTLVVCSDGLWSYFPDAPLLDKLVAFHDDATEAELAMRLVNHALVAGGEDNVSVIVFKG